MFDSLDEQMKHDDAVSSSPKERYFKLGLMAVVAIVVFMGVFMAVQMVGVE